MRLHRLTYNKDFTTGVLIKDTWPVCVTLEDPFKNNERNISCIPCGTYQCKRYSSPKYPSTFEITGVPDRDYILFHWGNTPEDTEGCILLGTYFSFYKPMIKDSKKAFNHFMKTMDGIDEFELQITQGAI